MPTNPLTSITDYETFIYGLPDAFRCIRMSTLVVVHTGRVTAVVKGEIHFEQGLVLRVLEVVNARQQRIERYGYELWKGNEELCGTTRGRIPILQNWPVLTLITSTFLQTSNTIAFLRRA